MAVKERVGIVVSNKMDKTVVVAVESRAAHPKYGKIVVRTKRYKAHDEENKCQEGDRVRIQETRPLSRTKRWRVIEILGSSRVEVVDRHHADTAPLLPEQTDTATTQEVSHDSTGD